MTPRATYRLQFHAGFTFADAAALVPYLETLGVSHVYASPITVARPVSMHGYDVVDPTRINPELGGEDGFRALASALAARGMGIIIDIVPNHMGVGQHNPWWMDVLANGSTSRYAQYFDIGWARAGGKIVLPFLGAPLPEALASGDLRLAILDDTGEIFLCAYGDTRYPLRPETLPGRDTLSTFDPDTDTGRDALARLIAQQHYRLVWWRQGHDVLNWRRFFSVTELAGLRIEDANVFETTHALYFRLFAEGLIDGVRIDHVDGLTDPTGYLVTLRAKFDALTERRAAGDTAWIVVEKILGPGEALPPDWPVDGTSGYDFMELVTSVLHDPSAETLLTETWQAISGRSPRFATEEVLARHQMLAWEFSAQRDDAVAAFAALAAHSSTAARYTEGMIGRAIDALVVAFPVYRTYGTGAAALSSDAHIRAIARERATPHIAPGEAEIADWIVDCLAGAEGEAAAEAVQRFQQLTAPIAAKSVEDTAFYRFGRLLSRNDVGFDTALFSRDAERFHRLVLDRADHFPHAMLATATHDHKRGEDVRARLAAISHKPRVWLDAFAALETALGARKDGIDRGDLYMLAQTLYGVWPFDGQTGLSALAGRVAAWQEKAVREAKLRSSWAMPDAVYESKLKHLIAWLCMASDAAPARAILTELTGAMQRRAQRLALIQTVLKLTLPGVPDIYQGTEIADLSLVDPDNRSPVDYGALRVALEGDHRPAKLATIAELLALRKAEPALFHNGDYLPLRAGPGQLAFARHTPDAALIVAVDILGSGHWHEGDEFDLPERLAATAGANFSPAMPSGGRAVCPEIETHGIVVRIFTT